MNYLLTLDTNLVNDMIGLKVIEKRTMKFIRENPLPFVAEDYYSNPEKYSDSHHEVINDELWLEKLECID